MIKRLLHMLIWTGRGYWERQIGTVIIGLPEIICSVIVLLFIKDLVNGVISSAPFSYILKLVIIIIALYTVSCISGKGGGYCFFLLQRQKTADLQKELFSKVLDVRKNWTLGGLLSRILSDAKEVADFGILIVPIMAYQIISLGLGFYVMVRLNVYLALIAIAMLPLIYIPAAYGSFGKIEKLSKEERKGYDRCVERLTEGAEVSDTIRLYNQQNFFKALFGSVIGDWFKRAKHLLFRQVLITTLQTYVSIIGPVVLLCIGVIMASKGMVDIGTVVAFFSYAPRLYKPVENIAEDVVGIQRVLPMYDRVSAILGEEEEVTGTMSFPEYADVKIRDFWFSYGESPVLKELNLDIKDGEHIAIVGGSGAGKTTLAYTLLGLCRPYKGSIEINNRPLGEYDLRDLRRHILYVEDGAHIFSGMSIKQNVILGDTFKPEDVEHAIEIWG